MMATRVFQQFEASEVGLGFEIGQRIRFSSNILDVSLSRPSIRALVFISNGVTICCQDFLL